jgi:hypothetical protein
MVVAALVLALAVWGSEVSGGGGGSGGGVGVHS